MSILQVDVPSYFVGLLLEDCQLPLPNHAHFILADPSIVLFYSISSTEIRCFVDVPGQKVPSIVNGEMENYLKTIVAPQVPTELLDAFVAAIDKGNIRTMPCKSMPADAHRTPGVLLMGDAFNMRHPISGGGMTVGLSDVIVLRNLLRPLHDLHDAAAVCKYLESFYILRKLLKCSYEKLTTLSCAASFLLFQAAAGIILPLMKAEGVRQTFFPATFPAYYRAPPAQLKR
ncbi:hypothetical protein GW17_00053594 [Ensete ventricosum]|nr:hypothetical protein GW17_00053594 [Ensete ventricosum]